MRRYLCWLWLVTIMLCSAGCWHVVKPLPAGLDYQGSLLPAEGVEFLRDQTYLGKERERRSDQQIFDEVFAMIDKAQHLIVADLFLYNTFAGREESVERRLCNELTHALIERKQSAPQLRIVLITDPINTVYGGIVAEHLAQLEAAGVEVVVTRLEELRDSNLFWTVPWRFLIQPWGNAPKWGLMPNPFGGQSVTLRSWFAALNFKANHRKVVIADDGAQWRALVTSANPHDGSSAHSNVALSFSGAAVHELADTEQAVLNFSAPHLPPLDLQGYELVEQGGGDAAVAEELALIQVVTEEAIASVAEYLMAETQAHDRIDLVMFYLSDRKLIKALKGAVRRGVMVRAVLDPNKDAFGYQKSGMPNRQVATELHRAGVEVCWAATHGEQMHTKMLLVRRAGERASMLLGSANYTRRNLRNFNLESNVRLEAAYTAPGMAEAIDYVDAFWDSSEARARTAPYQKYKSDSLWRKALYRFQEVVGLSTW